MDVQELMNAVSKSVNELHQEIETHHLLVASVLEQKVDERRLEKLQKNLALCPREAKLKAVIHEAIETLDESRKAFKSKKLEALRKKLTRVLIDAE
ncbi:MAG: hypothetical protein KQI78_14680 [Deltaproteobacteria bacterium]|nr:hypothetical protein [Deltaproteobacteria bacterium]